VHRGRAQKGGRFCLVAFHKKLRGKGLCVCVRNRAVFSGRQTICRGHEVGLYFLQPGHLNVCAGWALFTSDDDVRAIFKKGKLSTWHWGPREAAATPAFPGGDMG